MQSIIKFYYVYQLCHLYYRYYYIDQYYDYFSAVIFITLDQVDFTTHLTIYM